MEVKGKVRSNKPPTPPAARAAPGTSAARAISGFPKKAAGRHSSQDRTTAYIRRQVDLRGKEVLYPF